VIRARRLFLAAGLLVVIGAVIFVEATAPPPTPAERLRAAKDSASFAQLDLASALCKNAALNVLKSPSTARFYDDSVYTNDLGNGRSEIQMQVDAQNSFGAMMRTTVDCRTSKVKGKTLVTSFRSWQR
jgi:hypothetical protein